MNALNLLKSANLKPDETIFSIKNIDAMNEIQEFVDEWNIQLDFQKISHDEWKTIFDNYLDSIFLYHPENDHQLRGTFLRCQVILKKHGLTDDDIDRLDFC